MIRHPEFEHECARLIAFHAQATDGARWHEVAALFTVTGVMVRPTDPANPIEGRDAILASLLARPPRTTLHFVANVCIEMESLTTARGYSAIQMYVAQPAAEQQPQPPVWSTPILGVYHDRFEHTPDGWRFRERRGSLTNAATVQDR